MTDVTHSLHQILQLHLQQSDFELLGVTPLPSHRDKMVRLRTLQDLIEELDDGDTQGAASYFIQVRSKQFSDSRSQRTEPTEAKQGVDAVYLPNGKLNIQYLFRCGHTLFDAAEFLLAKNIYKTILKSGEASHTALYHLGRCLEAELKIEEAQNHYEQSIAYHPTLDAFKKLGAILIKQEKNQKAAEIFERALLIKDLSPDLQFELHKACGNCWTRVNSSENANRHFKLALEINPSADEIRSNLGILYLQNHQIDEAKRNLRDAIASNTKNALALAGLGNCYLAENDKKTAHDYFVQSLEIDLNNPTAIFHLVKCAFEIRSYASATRILQEYIEVFPVTPNLLYSLAGLQFHIGRIQESKETTSRILNLQPQHAGAKELLQRIEKYST